MRKLEKVNKESQHSILSKTGPVVSLTTFGERVHSVFYTIESIGCGDQLPSRLTLWLNDDQFKHPLPDSLTRLVARGLDIRPCVDHGPHKKYLPEVQAYPDLDTPFVTADDDTLYPRFWLKKLFEAYQSNPSNIYCFRAHQIRLKSDATFENYKNWGKCLSKEPSHLHFSTGDCGVLFPPKMRTILNEAGLNFIEKCPKADDIWLNRNAFSAGVPVSQVVLVSKRFYEVPGTRGGALAQYNNGQGGNDKQLSLTYSEPDRLKLLSIQKNAAH